MNLLYGMYSHSNAQKQLHALSFICKVFLLSILPEYTVQLAVEEEIKFAL